MTGNLKISDSTPPLPPPKQPTPTIKPAGQQIAKASSVESISHHRSSHAEITASSSSIQEQQTEATSSSIEIASPNGRSDLELNDPNEARPSLFQLPKPRVSPELKISHRTSVSDSKFQSQPFRSSTASRDKEDSVLDTTTLIDDLVAQAEASENSLESDSVNMTESSRPKTPPWFTTLGSRFNQAFVKIRNTLQDSKQSSRVLRWSAVGITALLLVWGGSHLFGSDDSSIRVAEEEHRPQAMGQKASYDSSSNKKTSALVAKPKAIEDDQATVPAEDSALAKAESASTTIPGGIVATLNGQPDTAEAETPDNNEPTSEEPKVEENSLDNTEASERQRAHSNSRKSTRSRRKKNKQPKTTGTTGPTKADNSNLSAKSVVPAPHRDTPDAKSLLAKARKSRGLKAYQLAQRSYKLKPTRSSLVIMARAACEMKNTRKAKSAYNKLPFGKQRRSVRSTCRKLGVKVGF